LVLRLIAAHGPPHRYLDIGSGQGDLAVAVAGRWPAGDITGVELSQRGVDIAARKLPRGRFLRRWIAPGAHLIVTVPGGPMSAFDRHVGHRRHYTVERLAALLEATGFSVVECGGAGFPLFNLYRRIVIARGERLVADVNATSALPLPALAAMAVFDRLLAASPTRGRRGWQLYATATLLRTEQ
jgi:hypothetical protein